METQRAMKLFEVYAIEPRYAWFEPAQGPHNVMGVRLAFVEPIKSRLDYQIQDATQKKDIRRKETIQFKKHNYLKQGEEIFTPDLGWWPSSTDFENGNPNVSGWTKGNVFAKYPNLEIFPSKEAAIAAAKKNGVL